MKALCNGTYGFSPYNRPRRLYRSICLHMSFFVVVLKPWAMVPPGLRLSPPATSRSADPRSLQLISPVLKVWGLGACLQWNSHLAYPASLQALYSNNSDIKEIERNRIKNPNWQGGTSSLFTSVAEDLNSGLPWTYPASGQSRTRTLDRRIASPTRWPLGHAVSAFCILQLC